MHHLYKRMGEKNMKKRMYKAFAMVLALIMCLNTVNLQAFAQEQKEQENVTDTIDSTITEAESTSSIEEETETEMETETENETETLIEENSTWDGIRISRLEAVWNLAFPVRMLFKAFHKATNCSETVLQFLKTIIPLHMI